MTKYFNAHILVLAIVFLFLSFLVPTPDFESLKYIKGTVVDISLKKNGVGALFVIENEKYDRLKLEISHLSEENNGIVRAMSPGDLVSAWYLDYCCWDLEYQSVWQLESRGLKLQDYSRSLKNSVFTRNIILFMSFVTFIVSILKCGKFNRRIKND